MDADQLKELATNALTVKYIAFEGTYNEQVYDSEAHTVTWPDGRSIEDVTEITEAEWRKCDEKVSSSS